MSVESNPGPEANKELDNGVQDTRHSMMSHTHIISDVEPSSQNVSAGPAARQPEITDFFKKTVHLRSPGPPPPGDGSNLKRKKQSKRKSAQKKKKSSGAQCTSSPQGRVGRQCVRQRQGPEELESSSSEENVPINQMGRSLLSRPITVHPATGFQFPVHVPISIPMVTSSLSTQQPAVMPHLQQLLTHPIQEPFQICHQAWSPLVTSAPHFQPHFAHYGGGVFQEMQQPEQLPPVLPIQPPPFSYVDNHHASLTQPFQSLPEFVSCPPPEMEPIVGSTAAYQVEELPTPFPQSLPHSEPLDAVFTTLPAASAHMTQSSYCAARLQESSLPMRESQTAGITHNEEQLSPKEKKSSLFTVKPKVEWSPKKEPDCFKVEQKQDFKMFSACDVEKSDLAAEKKLLIDMIRKLKEQIAEKDEQIAERDKQIAKEQHFAKYTGQKEAQIHGELSTPPNSKADRSAKIESYPSSSEQAVMKQKEIANDVTSTEYLRGFETFATTSIVVSNNHSHSFIWKKHGLKLHIPGGAVSEEHIEYKVDIKVGFTGQFNIPDDLQLVSCVYWLSCPVKFRKPVTLEIEHCVSFYDHLQSTFLRFIVARCCQVKLPYEFRVLEKGTFVAQSSYGSIEVSQFSFFGIVIPRRFLSHQRYSCTHHYIRKDVHQWDVDFIITTGLEASLTAIEERYSSLDTVSGPDFEVQFEKDAICLAIPGDGLHVNGWEIRPLVPPAIAKQQVDAYKPGQKGQRVPYCRLQVKLEAKGLTELVHKVELQGAKSPWNFFTITCPPKEHVEKLAQVTGGKRKNLQENEGGVLKKKHLCGATDMPTLVAADGETILPTTSSVKGGDIDKTPCKPQLKSLMDALYHTVASKWKTIGILLEIPKGKLAGIERKCQHDPHSCLVELLETWLERVNPPATWSSIIDAVEFLGEEQLGKQLREKYIIPLCSASLPNVAHVH